MPRFAFKLRIKPHAGEEYDKAHSRVWPELLQRIKQHGISDYSIFRRGQDLVLVFRAEEFEKCWGAVQQDPLHQKWVKEMEKYFEPVPDLQPGEKLAMMKEIFYLE